MKRDMDLIRLILLEIEKSEYDEIDNFQIEGYDLSEIRYNGELLYQAGMVTKFYQDSIGELVAGSLTWDGCDFLDKIRDNSVWKKTKDIIKEQGLPLIVGTINTIASTIITSMTEGVMNSMMKNGGVS